MKGLFGRILVVLALVAPGCVVEVGRNAYEGCTPGEVCSGATSCQQANVRALGTSAGFFCTATCAPGSLCPSGADVCYAAVAGGTGLCYRSCASGCLIGTRCVNAPGPVAGTVVQLCAP